VVLALTWLRFLVAPELGGWFDHTLMFTIVHAYSVMIIPV
jgi:hypothetical protein